jgi:hypothetical protein
MARMRGDGIARCKHVRGSAHHVEQFMLAIVEMRRRSVAAAVQSVDPRDGAAGVIAPQEVRVSGAVVALRVGGIRCARQSAA